MSTNAPARPSATGLLDRYRADPCAFSEEVLHFSPWSRQRMILESVRDHTRTAVRSCHGPGKTAVAARAVLWFLACFTGSRVITTGPTWAQVRDLLWREIALAHAASDGFIGGELVNTRLELATDWFALGLSSDRAERFQGHHAEHLLLVVDEASGVSEEVFEAAAGFLTAEGARLLLIGNPTKTSGEFFDAFHSARAFYNCIRIAATDTPAFTGEPVAPEVMVRLTSRQWVEDMTAKWGEGSPLWQVRIAAEFPSESDDVVVSLGDLETAGRNEAEPGLPLVLSVDVARFGSDATTFLVRQGPVARLVHSYSGRDLMRTTGEVTRLARELQRAHGTKPLLVVDDAGLGGGVVDRLRELGEFKVVAYLGARAARSPADYPNARSEDWFRLAEALPRLDLDPADDELATDLLAPRYSLDSQARRVVEPKSLTKSRLKRSPDRADALVMAYSTDKVSPMRVARPKGRLAPVASRRSLPLSEQEVEIDSMATATRLGVPLQPVAPDRLTLDR